MQKCPVGQFCIVDTVACDTGSGYIVILFWRDIVLHCGATRTATFPTLDLSLGVCFDRVDDGSAESDINSSQLVIPLLMSSE